MERLPKCFKVAGGGFGVFVDSFFFGGGKMDIASMYGIFTYIYLHLPTFTYIYHFF